MNDTGAVGPKTPGTYGVVQVAKVRYYYAA